jgi:hypothetical protein
MMKNHRTVGRRPRIAERVIQEVALAIGHTVWQLQVLEDALAAHLVLLHDVQPGCTGNELEAALSRRRGLTFGKLLEELDRALRAKETLPSPVRSRLDALKQERNWLVHRSRRDSHVEINRAAGAARVLSRIEKLHDDTTALMRDVQDATELGLRALGIPREQITERANAILRSWETGQRHPDDIGYT